MNKNLLSTALLTILSASSAYADNTTVLPAAPAAPDAAKSALPATPAPQPAVPVVINCKFHIPAETTKIEDATLSTWAGKAAVQSFEFNPASIDQELVELKSCYTDQGWTGFNDALQKSGNIDAIKTQHLTVSSQVDGDVKINPVKDNQWKATVPVQVVYQNDKEKLTQLLTIDLLISRKISGDLGIMQMIATPRQSGQPAATPEQTPPAPAAPLPEAKSPEPAGTTH